MFCKVTPNKNYPGSSKKWPTTAWIQT